MSTSYVSVTEVAGELIADEQLERMHHRYEWAARACPNKDVLEIAAGTGPGLGLLEGLAKSVIAGDVDPELVKRGLAHYGDRIPFLEMRAEQLQAETDSLDVVILFEAVYYLEEVDRWIEECARVLRPGGVVLLATANKDLFDFNPSPFSVAYYNAPELAEMFQKQGFSTKFFGYLPTGAVSPRQRISRPLKMLAVTLRIFPRTARGKLWLKRLFVGKLLRMPAELRGNEFEFKEPSKLSAIADLSHKVLYCEATLPRETVQKVSS
jgi:SAM-dependent methyltransferase